MSGPDDFGDYTISPPSEVLAIAAVTNGEMWRMGGKFDEHSANANLIAAAPDLHKALVEARDAVAELARDNQPAADLLHKIDFALARADGT